MNIWSNKWKPSMMVIRALSGSTVMEDFWMLCLQSLEKEIVVLYWDSDVSPLITFNGNDVPSRDRRLCQAVVCSTMSITCVSVPQNNHLIYDPNTTLICTKAWNPCSYAVFGSFAMFCCFSFIDENVRIRESAAGTAEQDINPIQIRYKSEA